MPIKMIKAITAQSMADAFGVSVSTVNRLIRELAIKPTRRISGLRLFSKHGAARIRQEIKDGSKRRT